MFTKVTIPIIRQNLYADYAIKIGEVIKYRVFGIPIAQMRVMF